MNIENKVEQLFKKWNKHIENQGPSSLIHKTLICEPSKSLLKIGKPVIPYAKAEFEKRNPGSTMNHHCIPYLLFRIAPKEYNPPKRKYHEQVSWDRKKLNAYTRKWLSEYTQP